GLSTSFLGVHFLEVDEVHDLLDHAAERRRVLDHHLGPGAAKAEALDHFARVLDLADGAAGLPHVDVRFHAAPPSGRPVFAGFAAGAGGATLVRLRAEVAPPPRRW